MTSRELASVLLKVLGVIWLISAVSYFLEIPSVLPLTGQDAENYKLVKIIECTLLGALYLTAGSCLIWKTDSIVKAMRVRDANEGFALTSRRAVSSIGFGIVGLYISVLAIINLVQMFASYPEKVRSVTSFSAQYRFADFLSNNYPELLTYLLELLLGVLLFAGRDAVVCLFQKVRSMRDQEAEDSPSTTNGT